MPNEDLAAILATVNFERAPRGYAVAEVDELVARAADEIRRASSAEALEAVVAALEDARFTPEVDGYAAFEVRTTLSRVANHLRAAAASAMLGGGLFEEHEAEDEPDDLAVDGMDDELGRLTTFEHDLTARLARLEGGSALSDSASADDLAAEVARLRNEIREAGETLRDLLRHLVTLRRRAHDELRQEIEDLRRQWTAELERELAARREVDRGDAGQREA